MTISHITLAFVVFACVFLIFYILIYAFKPKRLMFTGPDKRPSGGICMRRAVLVSTVIALSVVVVVLFVHFLSKRN
jgi:archaellum biogenesis protein FlaJ (TadC family)